VRIVDADDPGRELGAGEIGEIVVEAPQIMDGYWGDRDATASFARRSVPRT
jgi:long-chain acyl-CoA synthetase